VFKLAKHVHAKFQLSSLYPDGLRHIFDHFKRKFQDISGKLLSEFNKILTLVCNFMLNLAKHVHAKFQLSSLNPDGLRNFFELFSRKIQDFLQKKLEFSKSEKKTEKRFPKGIFYPILSHLAFFKSFE
jgi:hypothetical protein